MLIHPTKCSQFIQGRKGHVVGRTGLVEGRIGLVEGQILAALCPTDLSGLSYATTLRGRELTLIVNRSDW